MTATNTLTVLTTVRGGELAGVRRTASSLDALARSLPHFTVDWLVILDGAHEGCRRDLYAQVPVTVLRNHGYHPGVSSAAARNLALRYAQGDYLLILGPDDVILPGASALADLATASAFAAGSVRTRSTPGACGDAGGPLPEAASVARPWSDTVPWCSQGAFVTRAAVAAAGGWSLDPATTRSADMLMWARITAAEQGTWHPGIQVALLG